MTDERGHPTAHISCPDVCGAVLRRRAAAAAMGPESTLDCHERTLHCSKRAVIRECALCCKRGASRCERTTCSCKRVLRS
jgi:hypothetical protein